MPNTRPTSPQPPRSSGLLRRLWAWLGCALVLLGVASPGLAQVGGDGLGFEIRLEVQRFGVENIARRGDWCGVLVRVTDNGFQSRAVVLRIEGADADGDTPFMDRVITTNPGVPQSFWLYTRLPFGFNTGSSVVVSAHPALDDGGAGEGDLGYGVGQRLLGRVEHTPQRVLPPDQSAIGVVGPRGFGLAAYQTTANLPIDHQPLGHELTVLQVGLASARLPDEWQGLMPFSALVWGRGAGETDPGALTVDQTRALREWIARGGHLVVVLPAVGQEWTGQASNRLRSLLPAVRTPRRVEGVNLERYRALLAGDVNLPLPSGAVVHELEAASDAEPMDAVPLLTGPGGEVVAMQRVIGSGLVTLIGIDLGAPELVRFGLPSAESFWHRVLGKRGRVVTAADLDAPPLQAISNRLRNRDARNFDGDLAGEIARTGRSLQGLLLGVVVFAAYWLCAGPLGYYLLGRRGLKRHAWVAFVAVTGAFTAVAWSGAFAIRPKDVSAAAVTYLEHVHGEPMHRARSWISVLIPSYGDAAISVPQGDASGLEIGLDSFSPVIAPWSPPSLTRAQRFPDNRGYRVSAREPDTLDAPTRSTVKQVRVDWAGAPRWAMPEPIGELGETGVLRLARDEQRSATFVEGSLVHGLPAAMDDVRIIVVEGQKPVGRALGTGELISRASVYALSGAWEPGVVLDLAEATVLAPGTRRRRTTLGDDRFFGDILSSGASANETEVDPRNAVDRMLASLLISQAEPPGPTSWTATQISGPPLARRTETHAYDLGRWFTRPCVIVLGQVQVAADEAEPDAGPLPLEVSGNAVRVSGRTILSIVFPLDAAPPETVPVSVRPNDDPLEP